MNLDRQPPFPELLYCQSFGGGEICARLGCQRKGIENKIRSQKNRGAEKIED